MVGYEYWNGEKLYFPTIYDHKERQVTVYIKLRVKLKHEDGLTDGDIPIKNLSYLINYIQGNVHYDWDISGELWVMEWSKVVFSYYIR